MPGPAAKGWEWLNEQRRAAMRGLSEAALDVADQPLDALMRAVRGSINSGADVLDLVAGSVPGTSPQKSFGEAARAELGSGSSLVEKAGEIFGPNPMGPLTGATVVGGKALQRLGMQGNILKAQRDLKAGRKPSETYEEYRVEQAPDKEWITNVSDRGAELNLSRLGDPSARLGDILKHPTLYRADPDLPHIPTFAELKSELYGGSGSITTPRSSIIRDPRSALITAEAPDVEELLKSLLHEGTHGSAWLGRRATSGSSPDDMRKVIDQALERAGLRHDVDFRVAMRKNADPLYFSNLGESEARIAEILRDRPLEGVAPSIVRDRYDPKMSYMNTWHDERKLGEQLDRMIQMEAEMRGLGRKTYSLPPQTPTGGSSSAMKAPEPPPVDPAALADEERRIVTGVEGLTGEAKYQRLREIASQLAAQGGGSVMPGVNQSKAKYEEMMELVKALEEAKLRGRPR